MKEHNLPTLALNNSVKEPTRKKNGAARHFQARGPGGKKVGGALLSRALERSIIAAGALNGRGRDGNGCRLPAGATNQQEVAAGARPGTSGDMQPALSPGKPPARPFPARGKGRRPGLTAYQKRSAQGLAALALPPCRPGGLPGAFRTLRSGTARLRGGLALRCLQRLSLRDVATRRCP